MSFKPPTSRPDDAESMPRSLRLRAVLQVPGLGRSTVLGVLGMSWNEFLESRRQESNLYLPLRRRPFYPLNYGEQGPAARAFYESFLRPIVGRTSVAEIAS